jgi:glycopeptide antibiotics resistance protein
MFIPGMVDLAGTGMWLRSRETRFATLTAAAVVAICFICLYPFRFSIRHGDINAVGALIGSWAEPPQPIDFILNIVLYAPLGVFGVLSSSPRPRRPWRRIAVVTTGGTLLSITMGLAQYFDASRYTAASDVYANVLGAFLGAAGVVLLFRR